jgi:hypothetical protein
VSRYYKGSSEEEAFCLSMCVGVRVLNLYERAEARFTLERAASQPVWENTNSISRYF